MEAPVRDAWSSSNDVRLVNSLNVGASIINVESINPVCDILRLCSLLCATKALLSMIVLLRADSSWGELARLRARSPRWGVSMTRRCARKRPGSREIVAARVPPVSTIAEMAGGCRVIGMAWSSASAPRSVSTSRSTSCYIQVNQVLLLVACGIGNTCFICRCMLYSYGGRNIVLQCS